MLSAGTSKTDDEAALSFLQVQRHRILQQIPDLPVQGLPLFIFQHIVLDCLIFSCQITQLTDIIGIRQAADIKNDVGIGKDPVFVAEGHEFDHHRGAAFLPEDRKQLLAQGTGRQTAGIDHDIGKRPQR